MGTLTTGRGYAYLGTPLFLRQSSQVRRQWCSLINNHKSGTNPWQPHPSYVIACRASNLKQARVGEESGSEGSKRGAYLAVREGGGGAK